MGHSAPRPSVVVVGGGFAGIGCARALDRHDVDVTVIDRNDYHQFQPLLYQVATAELASSDVARPLRAIFARQPNVTVRQVEVTAVDPATRTVTGAGGETFQGDHLVLAAGAEANFFHTPGAAEHAFPLYTVRDATRLRARLFELFDEVATDPSRIDRGALDLVVVGAGPTGVETAGALADLVNDVVPERYGGLDVQRARIEVVDHGPVVLRAFSQAAHAYAAAKLAQGGVHLRLGTSVREVRADRVVLGDGTEIPTRAVVWAGGSRAAALAGRTGLPQGRGQRLRVEADLTVAGFPGVYAVGDIANMPDAAGGALPQLGSVALQAGRAAAANILADIAGRPRRPFHYRDRGIMAMIGGDAAIAEIGAHHHELHGTVAFAAWLGVHAWLLSGVHQRVDAFVSWAWDFFGRSRSGAFVEDPEAARIDWADPPPPPPPLP